MAELFKAEIAIFPHAGAFRPAPSPEWTKIFGMPKRGTLYAVIDLMRPQHLSFR